MDIIYMLPFLLNKNVSDFIYDLKMSNDFFKSLKKCDYKLIFIYNEGCSYKKYSCRDCCLCN
ncbi:MAG: hypothetical protein E6248_13940 [Clostridium sp.]|uniref:hypothetical protein n=1 Tax=Clostridium sp. TaxID=1506 RepID=UPI0029075A56|nr:hypothetical protein [Clostridium sp.]MDU5111543.1 hypothetical protein [Clostridium sp.]